MILLLSVNAMLGDTHFDENRDSQFQPRCWVTRLADCVDSKIAGNRYWDRKCSWEGPFGSAPQISGSTIVVASFTLPLIDVSHSPNRLDIVLASHLTGRIRTADQIGFLCGYLALGRLNVNWSECLTLELLALCFVVRVGFWRTRHTPYCFSLQWKPTI